MTLAAREPDLARTFTINLCYTALGDNRVVRFDTTW
jgi:hypothetical protein